MQAPPVVVKQKPAFDPMMDATLVLDMPRANNVLKPIDQRAMSFGGPGVGSRAPSENLDATLILLPQVGGLKKPAQQK